MDKTPFPNGRGQNRTCASALRQGRAAGSFPAALLTLIDETIGDSDTTFLNDYERFATAAGAETAARADADEKDITFEEELRLYIATLRARHGAAAVAAVRSAMGGGPVSEVLEQPSAQQVQTFERAFAVLEGRTDLKLADARLDTLKELNEALRLAVLNHEQAKADREVKRSTVEASERDFVTRYRKLIRLATLTLGEDVVLAQLPQFERSRRGAAKADDSVQG
ncbi:hypothetical protein L6R49_18970 [Myxococcota bacterium]|nr:hypothetical protein [Myxococcota bacterium]